jgi:GT2 family glycosyltransferase
LPLPPLPARYEVTVIETDSLETAAQGRDCCDVALFLHRGLRFPAWEEFLAELCGWALRPGGGVAAAQVVTPDGRIIHAGLSLAQPETQALQFDFEGGELNPLARRVRDCLAVSGMALAVTAPRLRALAESPLNGEAWDIDLCLRARAAGMRVVYNPHARAVCAIDPARLQRHSDWATAALLTQHRIERDPYFNPYLSSPWHDFRLPRQLPLEISAAQRKAGKLPEDAPQPVQWTAPPPAYALPPPLRALSRRPFFSIILTTYNSHLDYLREMAESIHRQSYPYFEVCLSDDASSEPRLISYLRGFPLNDSRFRVYFSRQRGGIARNTNRALEMAGGDWLVLCDHDDRLESHALQCLAEYINDHPDVEIIYSDEDLMDEQGRRHNPHCRPDWNPDMFSSQMYFPHLVAIKSALADRVGWMNPELDGAQDYDFLLRLTEQGVIGHIPKVLYSWRCHPGSVAQDAAAKVYAYEAGRRALQSAMQRRGEDAVVVNAPGTALGVYRVKRRLRGDAVSHIIHANHPEALQAVRNLQREAKQPIEIIAVAPEDQPELARQLAEISEAKIISAAAGASQAACYNLGAQAAGGKILLFSPAELEVIDSDYPAAGVEHAQRDGIGAVGSRLIYPGGGYYHSGLILGVNGGVGYAHRNLWQGPGYWYYALCIRNYSAVSWDLMSVAKEKWEQAGGFDEELKMFADVDFCLKLSQRGLRHVYTPYLCGVLKRPIHRLEELQNPGAVEILRQRYGAIMDSDPCYHPLLSRQWENFSLRPEFGG